MSKILMHDSGKEIPRFIPLTYKDIYFHLSESTGLLSQRDLNAEFVPEATIFSRSAT
tara:strand:+ start:274 stop:444 length:171 start_codon:yes stop_codon:yes gene_type:complete